MSVPGQISLGSLTLLLCTGLHIAIILQLIVLMRRHRPFDSAVSLRHRFGAMAMVVLACLGSHTVQVWLWAALLLWVEGLSHIEEAIYFSLVSYTTLGYGDVVLDQGFRVLGGMISVNGILLFGVTTAFLVNLFAVLLKIGSNEAHSSGQGRSGGRR